MLSAVTATPTAVDDSPRITRLELTVSDPDVVAELSARPEGRERHDYAAGALRIGTLALRQARGSIDAESIRREGERIVDHVRATLESHRDSVMSQLGGRLAEYLDPDRGRFQERVDRLVRKGGDLEQLIQRHVGLDDSSLARTLREHLGQGSPLMAHLSPTNVDGLLQGIVRSVKTISEEQRDRLLREFTLDNADGALARVVGELKGRQGKLENGLQELLKALAAELSLDKDGSAISRLRRDVLEVLGEQTKRSLDFEKEVRETLVAMAVRKKECARSTRHGEDFEMAVFEALQAESQPAGDVAERLGSTYGEVPRSKIGDFVVELGPDQAAAGSRIVVEAKENASYSLAAALEEIAKARKNRRACTGLFVFSSRTAPEGLAPIARYGSDVVVVWDAEAPDDIRLKAGLIVARAICVQDRRAVASAGADFCTIDQAVLAIEEQAKVLDDIQKLSTTVKGHGEKIQERAGTLKSKLLEQVATLTDRVTALKGLSGQEGA